MKKILVIGGLDPSGSAGLAADLCTVASLGAHGAPVAAALTAQNTRRFHALAPVEADTLADQLRSVLEDLEIDAVKIGMLGTASAVETIHGILETRFGDAWPPLVLDPVLASSTGGSMARTGTVESMVGRLFPHCTLLTPNALEAADLTGEAVENADQARRAGERLLEMGPQAVLVKGGHLSPPGSDYLARAEGVRVFEGMPIRRGDARGTGCALAAAIAVGLADGRSIDEAVSRARSFIRVAISEGRPLSSDRGPSLAGPAGTSRRAQTGGLHVIVENPAQAAAAIGGGATTIQYRKKNAADTKTMLDEIAAIQALGVRVIVNDRADLAFAAKAEGVHLGARDLDPRAARSLLGPAAMIGATANSLEQALSLFEEAGSAIDYLGVGPVFGTTSKKNPAARLGLDALSRIVDAVPRPIVAIGGIHAGNVADVLRAGATGVAVLSAVASADDPKAATRCILQAMGR